MTSNASQFSLRPIAPADNAQMAEVIRQVSAEYGLTPERGFAVGDASVDVMYETYATAGAAYWVVEYDGRIVGGGGVAPLAGGDGSVAELQKMYFLPVCRGQGLGYKIALMAQTFAKDLGFKQCYLETTAALKEAITLYERLGFKLLTDPMGDTGHQVCEVRMIKALD
ncbi:GNAT family N-acetyltransferase [Hahella sp. KA22]|uniref:GNAT family N-acetyltransferase n=1 Tax=Hahella sp. KA22 TaxID=1628392 RepID=UPI000FDE9B05|nr:GNAT family N-acetyltransferase [Hahella sp. KA22]AZZ90027.1 GNAT family N-acetyltransferase [Hahella sp. KA22]QAY53397.1 GNAT family N-acetyltransferase [Hahella sp. KA22]